MKNKHIGSSLDDFLREEGILEEVHEVAIKRVLAWQIQQAMKEKRITKSALAKAMNTSRAALNRLLDPENESVTLQTFQRVADALEMNLSVKLQS